MLARWHIGSGGLYLPRPGRQPGQEAMPHQAQVPWFFVLFFNFPKASSQGMALLALTATTGGTHCSPHFAAKESEAC